MVRNLRTIVRDGLMFYAEVSRRRTAVAGENLFLRKQLALFREREKKAMPTTPADRFVFSKLARWFDWRSALLIVKPATLIGWHRNAFRLFWRWKSRPVGRPPVTAEVRALIRRLAAENPTWGEQRIADELWLKLQIRLSPRTVAKYSKQRPGPRRSRDQRWSTFLKDHANAIEREPNLQLQPQLIGNALFSPGWILSRQTPDQVPDFGRHWWSPDRSRFPPPEETECVAVPADQSGWFDDQQCTTPVEPASQFGEYKSVGRSRGQRFLLPFSEKNQLLAQKQILSC